MRCILHGHEEGKPQAIGDGRYVVLCVHCGKTLKDPHRLVSSETTPKPRGYESVRQEHAPK